MKHLMIPGRLHPKCFLLLLLLLLLASVTLTPGISLSATLGEAQVIAAATGELRIYPSPHRNAIAIKAGMQWYISRRDQAGQWQEPTYVADRYGGLAYIGWTSNATGQDTMVLQDRSGNGSILTTDVVSRDLLRDETDSITTARHYPIVRDEAQQLVLDLLSNLKTNKPTMSSSTDGAVQLTYPESDVNVTLDDSTIIYDTSVSGSHVLCLPDEKSPMTNLDLRTGETHPINIKGHASPPAYRTTGVYSPNGEYILALFFYDPDHEVFDGKQRWLQIFTNKGESVCEVVGLGDLDEEWVNTDIAWPLDDWFVYTTDGQVVFQEFLDEKER